MANRVISFAVVAVLFTTAMGMSPGIWAATGGASAVTVEEDVDSFVLGNGIVMARILKQNGDIRSLKFNGVEVLTDRSGHAGGYWSHDPTGGSDLITSVTIDPDDNGGKIAEVSVKGISGGAHMGHGPGTPKGGDIPADIEIRYALRQGDSGVYAYCIFDHLPEYGAATMAEARFAVKLAEFFDWMSIDADRNKFYPKADPSDDKYSLTAVQSQNRAYGFSSTSRDIGFYLINPSIEYLSGGPTKPEFLCHRDTTAVQAPVVLNYWRSSHYGGANVSVRKGEEWTKVIGPFLMYVNEGGDPNELWRDAQARADAEAKAWPYEWVDAKGYTKPSERGQVTGRLVLDDPIHAKFPGKVWVGLAHSPYQVASRRGVHEITWQTDAKHYQFWSENVDSSGAFTIPDVSPGTYTFYAIADGVLGEFQHHDVEIEPGAKVDLGEITWTPVRRGKQLWEVGTPDRTAKEFVGGDRFFDSAITLEYPKLFPDDVTYTIGESQPDEDWFFAHVPHTTDPEARVLPYRGVSGVGRATPYTICFTEDEQPVGKAVLRLAICGTSARSIDVTVNGEPAGKVRLGRNDGVIPRHQVQGLWYERELSFDASLLKGGDNRLTLAVPAGPVNNGVIYDYLRLELDSDTSDPQSGMSRPAAGDPFAVSTTADAEASQSAGAEQTHQQVQPPTNTDESAVRDYTLPDVLVTASGESITSAQDWKNERRPELLKLFAEHQFGVTPSTTIKAEVKTVERDAPALDGAARRTQVRLKLSDESESPAIRVLRYVPADATGPVPTVLYLSFSPNVLAVDEPGIDEGMAWDTRQKKRVPDRQAFGFGAFDVKSFIDRGYGIAMVYYGDIEPDFDHGGKHGVRSLFGADGSERAGNEWGSIGAWSWGLSRVMDYLETDPKVDEKQVALAGVSRLGKTVLWAGAQDERFAMVIPLMSGEGGAAISRRNFGETVADLTKPSRYHYWYAPKYADYAFDVDALPVDGHMLLSLIAPRPILLVVGSDDTWSDPKGEWAAAKAAEKVFELYGLSGPGAEAYPSPNTYLNGDIGFYMHQGGHKLLPQDLDAMADFMDRHFKQPAGAD